MSNQNGLETTVKGLLNKVKILQSISHNISNVNTAGFKREIPETINFQSILNDVALRDDSQGPLKRTGNELDLAINGNAFFLAESKYGPIPTKNGSFKLNEKGLLSTQDGKEVVIIEKTDKPISLAQSKKIKISNTGEIFADGERYGRLAMKIMDSKPVKVVQGHLEGSNVDLANEMVSFSFAFRSFEASEKVLGMEMAADKELIEKYGRNV